MPAVPGFDFPTVRTAVSTLLLCPNLVCADIFPPLWAGVSVIFSQLGRWGRRQVARPKLMPLLVKTLASLSYKHGFSPRIYSDAVPLPGSCLAVDLDLHDLQGGIITPGPFIVKLVP